MVLPEPSTRALLVPLAVGRAVADALGVYTDRALLKWPNDLVVPNAGRPARKLAGTLIDRIDSPTLGPTLVVGVGVNVDSEPSAYPPDLKDRVVQLSELAGRPVPVAEVERAVVPAVAGVPATLATPEGAARLLARLRRELFGLGRPVRVDGVSAGVLDSVDDDGALLLASGGVTTRVVAGEVALEGSG